MWLVLVLHGDLFLGMYPWHWCTSIRDFEYVALMVTADLHFDDTTVYFSRYSNIQVDEYHYLFYRRAFFLYKIMVIHWVYRFRSCISNSYSYHTFVSIPSLMTIYAGVSCNVGLFRRIDANYNSRIALIMPNFMTVLSFERRRDLGTGVVCVMHEHDTCLSILFSFLYV